MSSDFTVKAGQWRLSKSHVWAIWGILKQEILYLSWALMEIALLAPLVLFVMAWARYWPMGQITLWLLLLILLPFNLVRMLSGLQMPKNTQWRIVLLALVITLFVNWRMLLFNTIPLYDLGWIGQIYRNFGESGSILWSRILILFFIVVFTWWRGLGLVNFRADIQSAGWRLRVGILLFIPIILLPGLRLDAWGTMPYVLLFFLSGLTAISLIRAEQVERERSGFSASLSPPWVGTIFLTSLIIVLISAMFALIVGGDSLGLISNWLAPLKTAVLVGLAVALSTVFFLATPLFFLFDLFLNWLTSLLSLFFTNINDRLGFIMPGNEGGFQPFLPTPEEAAEATGIAIPDIVTRLIIFLVMVGIILLVSLALTRRFRNASFAPRSTSIGKETRNESSVGSSMGQRILDRLGILTRWRTAASIRSIYRQMCRAAESAGYARAATETPYEYLSALEKVWPEGQSEIRIITEAFVKVRYGEIPETAEELAQIGQAWQRLEQTRPPL